MKPSTSRKAPKAFHALDGLGKGLGVLRVGLDSLDTVNAAKDGDYSSAAHSGTKAPIGAGSFLPPPAGTDCMAASGAATVESDGTLSVSGPAAAVTRTADGGRLHSYAADEIGFARAGSGPIVTTAPGMPLFGLFFAAVTAFSIFLIAAPPANGQDPLWVALVLTSGGIAGLVYAVRLARSEFRARRIRREPGVPDPSPRQLN